MITLQEKRRLSRKATNKDRSEKLVGTEKEQASSRHLPCGRPLTFENVLTNTDVGRHRFTELEVTSLKPRSGTGTHLHLTPRVKGITAERLWGIREDLFPKRSTSLHEKTLLIC